jgi:Fe-S oxidoreductase
MDILTYDGVRMTVGKTSDEELQRLCAAEGRVGEIYRGLKRIRDTYDNEIRAQFPKIPRRVSGYSIDELLPENGFHVARALVGSESTCVTILHATLQLIPDPKKKVILVIGYDSVEDAADAVPRILPFREHGMIALEGMDELLADYMRKKNISVRALNDMPKGKGWLFAQFGGATMEEAQAKAAALKAKLEGHRHIQDMKLLSGAAAEELWDMRKGGLGATCWVQGLRDTWEGWEDSAVHPDNLGAYMRELRALFNAFGYHGAFYGHFGDGLIHTRIDSGLHTREEVAHFRRFLQEAAGLVVRYGGTLSGEHGDGRSRAELLPVMFGPKLMLAFEEFKTLWDPQRKMNPGKLVWPKPIDTDIRYGPDYQQRKAKLDAFFYYPEGNFERAAMRCVGVGECRRHEGGTMCPSYRGTREEQYSTRGRARLLQEMLQNGPIDNSWQSDAVRESLDLCLSCKACKSECPVNVDMAAYRAEFLYHHFQHRRRPLASFSMGLVHRWAPLASRMPWLMNLATQTPGLNVVAKWAGGVHRKRSLPKLAAKTFRAHWETRGPAAASGTTRALLWADTFNNYFTPAPLIAAAEVLERCGYQVLLPKRGLCCGRPYYDFGRLPEAKAMLAHTLEFVAPLLDDDTWLVGVEASCMSVFREELLRLFPEDARAKRVAARTLMLGAFLRRHGHKPIHLAEDVVLHGHCHHKAIFGAQDDVELLKTSGRNVELLDAGCCGMAGAFGYEKKKYAVSEAIARQGIVAQLAKQPRHITVSADGFSCRHQIAHFTDRKTVTLPELLRQSME